MRCLRWMLTLVQRTWTCNTWRCVSVNLVVFLVECRDRLESLHLSFQHFICAGRATPLWLPRKELLRQCREVGSQGTSWVCDPLVKVEWSCSWISCIADICRHLFPRQPSEKTLTSIFSDADGQILWEWHSEGYVQTPSVLFVWSGQNWHNAYLQSVLWSFSLQFHRYFLHWLKWCTASEWCAEGMNVRGPEVPSHYPICRPISSMPEA